MANVQVYSQSYCPFCVRAKTLLKQKGIAFEEINLDDNDGELEALKARTGLRTIPQIFINGTLVGGYNELAALEAQGKLSGMVAAPAKA